MQKHLEEPKRMITYPAKRHLRCVLVDGFALTRDCIISATRFHDEEILFASYNSVREFTAAQQREFDAVLYYAHEKAALDRLVAQEIATLRQACPDTPIVILLDTTQAMQSSIVREALRAGARGVISTRTIEMATVSAAIRYVVAGGIVVPSDMILSESPTLSDSFPRLPEQIDLTSRQITVLARLRQGKANKIIAHELQMSESTVKVHVRNIMRKMGATNRTQAVYNARRLGEGIAMSASAQD